MTQSKSDAPEATQPAMLNWRAQGRFRKVLSEPLFHFLVVGVIVFGAYWLFDKAPDEEAQEDTIEINANDIRQIIVAWLAQGRTPLTEVQLQSLVDQKITDEVLFREGLALGLDRDDEIIKRRIIQKMDFLAADVAALQEPGKADLMEWFSVNSERFALPPRASFRQIYFSPDKRGASARDDAAAALEMIAGKAIDLPEVAAMSDPFVLTTYYKDSTPDQILREFGPVFTEDLFKLTPGGWRGPVQSGYGWHLVWMEKVEPSRIPAFEEVEADIRAAWIDEKYREIKGSAIEEMRSRYTVGVVPLETVDLTDLTGANQAQMPAEAITQ